ncbi:MAG TPA: patatin-like phospholipase family protein [Candidatus Krumholzibacteria bacterium]|nr:patatin-like phospholipase family protein [Candidatus Krumholzibacteria bacterium]
MERDLRVGVSRNLRTRLFWNPVANLKIFCLALPPGRRMASLYHAHIYRPVTGQLNGSSAGTVKHGIALRDVRIDLAFKDIEAFNRRRPGEEQSGQLRDRVPKLVLNASCLNSGRPFHFSVAEVGDGLLGYIRLDEARLVRDCKVLLSRVEHAGEVGASLAQFARTPAHDGDERGRAAVSRQPGCITWFLGMEHVLAGEKKRAAAARPEALESADASRAARYFAANIDEARMIFGAEFTGLRRAKVAAWYLLDPAPWGAEERRGGYLRGEHQGRFWQAIKDIDQDLLRGMADEFGNETPPDLLEFVLCLYYLRSARAFAWDVAKGLEKLRLVDAAAASANFPPVFTPYHLHDLYDANLVKVLSLTDGGVHDNLGVETLIDEECTHIIASDASGLFRQEEEPAGQRFGMMSRIGSLLTAKLRGEQLDALHMRVDASCLARHAPHPWGPEMSAKFKLASTAYFHLMSNPSDAPLDDALPPHPFATLIARLRTDLDAFGSIEIDGLVYQGYQLADRFVRKYLDEGLWDARSPAPRLETPAGTPHVRRVLSAGAKLFGRLVAMYKTYWTVAGIVAAAGVFAAMWIGHVSLVEALSFVQSWFHAAAASEFCAFFRHLLGRVLGPVFTAETPWRLILFLLFVVVLVSTRWERVLGRLLVRGFGPRARQQGARLTAARIFGPWRRTLTWSLWLFPLWLSLLGTAVFSGLIVSGGIVRRIASRTTVRN